MTKKELERLQLAINKLSNVYNLMLRKSIGVENDYNTIDIEVRNDIGDILIELDKYKCDEVIDVDKVDVLGISGNRYDIVTTCESNRDRYYRKGMGYLPDGRGVIFILYEISDYKLAYCNYADDGDTCNNDQDFEYHFSDGKWRLARMNELGDWEFSL